MVPPPHRLPEKGQVTGPPESTENLARSQPTGQSAVVRTWLAKSVARANFRRSVGATFPNWPETATPFEDSPSLRGMPYGRIEVVHVFEELRSPMSTTGDTQQSAHRRALTIRLFVIPNP